ncbi:hypothetical protein WICMUC_000686 [Wickerhamomyces mucosus]|uniref:PhoD-like phosphatase domain-containing protein n=1 Tax=Wickerhamomyces mucosus TaxID=1378264 RepID=A0A9P8PX59_9ASCO|nr:hypothetical protein WICMUC_000686 [Wickerhamomyces mucosus]
MSISLSDWIKDYNSLESIFEQLKFSTENIPERPPNEEPIVEGLDIKCGPVLRLIATLENGSKNYRGSILLVTRDSSTTVDPRISFLKGPIEPQTTNELNSGKFPVKRFYQIQGHSFWRFEIDIVLDDFEQKVRYSINDSQILTFEFHIPKYNQTMNVISYSCNGFSLSTKTEDYKGSLWFDVIRKHYKQNRYHVMIGGGDQIYCDGIKNSSKTFHDWLYEKNPLKKRSQKLTQEIEDSFNTAYLNQYLAWFGSGYWKGPNGSTLQSLFPIAMTSIPSINIYDDHDIIDGYGSYHDSTMGTEVFKGLGLTAYKYYMLFQHHLAIDEPEYLDDPSWILSNKPGPSISEKSHSIFTRLGYGVGFLGLDCRTERKLKEVVTEDTYKLVFKRLEREMTQDSTIKHLYVLLGVPIAYTRLVWLEWLLGSRIMYPLRLMSQKGIIAKGLVNEFDGDVEVLDDLNDHWCARHHKRERNKFVGRLQSFGAKHGVRITILSGDVHLAAIGRFRTKLHLRHLIDKEKYEKSNEIVKNEPERDPRLMLNIISSAIVNAPPPDAMASLLYRRSRLHHFDFATDEDMVPIFTKDVDGSKRQNKEFLNRRNWADLIHISNIKNFDTAIGDIKLPGPIQLGHPDDLQRRDERELSYKVTENSVISTIYVEKDHNNVNSETQGYEVVIPELIEKSILKHVGKKYLGKRDSLV